MPKHPRRDHQDRKENAAAERNEGRQREARRRGTQRQHDADKAHHHGAPAAPANFFAKQDNRQRGYINRTREIKGDGIGQRQIGHRPEKHRHLESRKHDAHNLQWGLRGGDESLDPGIAEERHKEHQRRGTADQQEFADRIIQEKPFAEGIIG